MSHHYTSLAELIGSRICHDLISPIGAINNGLELLTMSSNTSGPEMGLIGESVNNASARIRFFRIAFGAAGDQMIGSAEVTSILRDLYGASRLEIAWTPTDPQPRAAVRLSFLSILCLENALPYGGHVEISQTQNNWALVGSGDRFNFDPEMWSVLEKTDSAAPPPKAIQPAQVQFALLPEIAREDGRTISLSLEETRATIRF